MSLCVCIYLDYFQQFQLKVLSVIKCCQSSQCQACINMNDNLHTSDHELTLYLNNYHLSLVKY